MATFTVTGSALHEAAGWASRIVASKPPVPLLGGLLLDAGDELAVTAFDFDTCGTATIPAVVKEPGRALVSARLLAAVAKAVARDVDVTIEADGHSAIARCGRSEWSLPTMAADEFPQLPSLGEQSAEVDADELRHALARVLPTVHTGAESSLANLAGVKLDGDPDGLTLVATDRYRVGLARIGWKADGETLDALVPGDLLEAAARASTTGTLRLAWDDRTFGLAGDQYRVVGRQIAERYPDIARFMPRRGEHRAIVDVADLARALDEAMVMLDRELTVRLSIAAESVEVSVVGDERRARADATVHALHGEPVTVAINARYLRTCLHLIESDAAVLHLSPRTILALPSDRDGTVIGGYEHVVLLTRAS